MIHILKLVYRNFKKNLTINLINLGGLTLSMAVVIMLSAYCYSELTTDQQHEDVDQKFLITRNKGDVLTPGILYEYLKTDIPEIKKVVRIHRSGSGTVLKTEDHEPIKTEMIYADEDFFNIFKYSVIHGDLNKALQKSMAIVLTSSEAIRLFGKTDVVGQTIEVNNQYTTEVSAIIEDPKMNSTLTFKVIMTTAAMHVLMPYDGVFNKWNYNYFDTYIQLVDNKNLKDIEKAIEEIVAKNHDNVMEFGYTKLIPISELYFSGMGSQFGGGDKYRIVILLIVAVLILLMAIINYLNISSYNMGVRLRQASLFKVMGANDGHIFKIYLVEAVLSFIVCAGLAIILSKDFGYMLTDYTGLDYNEGLLLTPSFIIIIAIEAILLAVAAIIVPTLKLLKFQPIKAIKKDHTSGSFTSFSKAPLVIFQFCAAIVLISFTILIQKQVDFGGKGLGYNSKNIVVIQLTSQLREKEDVMKNQLNGLAQVDKISFSQFYPGHRPSYYGTKIKIAGVEQKVQYHSFDADGGFFDIAGLELVLGRFYQDSIASDKNKIIVNEAFVKEYEIEEPIGAIIMGQSEVVGVVKDFHFMAKGELIESFAILNRTDYSEYCLVQINANNFQELSSTVDMVKNVTDNLSPDFPVEVSFLDTAIENMYKSEIQFRRTFTFFSGCAILISCLGILALSLFASQQRTKEIGIRKVNGAQLEDILLILNKDFLKWVGIAFVVATPLAYFAMEKWLQGYAYKTEINWWIFALGGVLSAMIALLTVSWQSWITAKRNPVEALRYE